MEEKLRISEKFVVLNNHTAMRKEDVIGIEKWGETSTFEVYYLVRRGAEVYNYQTKLEYDNEKERDDDFEKLSNI